MSNSKQLLDSPACPSHEAGTILVETERLVIRRFLVSDAADLAAATNHKEVVSQLSDRFQVPFTAEAAASLILAAMPSPQDDQVTSAYPRRVAVCLKANSSGNPAAEPRLIGSLIAHAGTDMAYKTWTIGYGMAPSCWGHGYATEAVRGFTQWLFLTWTGIQRLEASVFSTNPASAKVLLKVGFTEEGTRRSAMEKNGILVDVRQFGLLRDEMV